MGMKDEGFSGNVCQTNDSSDSTATSVRTTHRPTAFLSHPHSKSFPVERGGHYAKAIEGKQPRLGRADGVPRRSLLQEARKTTRAGVSVDRLLDSRVPANQIVDLDPGELFVHRNVANLAPPQDANYLSVLQFAIDILRVKHIIVVGHYGCGGVSAAVDGKRRGLVDHWLHPIREIYYDHRLELEAILDHRERLDRLCELNVIAK
jgi:hypothetical protein